MVTRPDEPFPSDRDVAGAPDGHSDRPEDNEGRFEVDTDALRVKRPEDDESVGMDGADVSGPVPGDD